MNICIMISLAVYITLKLRQQLNRKSRTYTIYNDEKLVTYSEDQKDILSKPILATSTSVVNKYVW